MNEWMGRSYDRVCTRSPGRNEAPAIGKDGAIDALFDNGGIDVKDLVYFHLKIPVEFLIIAAAGAIRERLIRGDRVTLKSLIGGQRYI